MIFEDGNSGLRCRGQGDREMWDDRHEMHLWSQLLCAREREICEWPSTKLVSNKIFGRSRIV